MINVDKKYRVAVVGATGLVGQEIIRWLNKLNFPYSCIIALASSRSENKKLSIDGKTYIVEVLNEKSFENVDIALFSAGSAVSKVYVPYAVKSGCVVIDNTSFFRMDKEVPLVAYGVNDEKVKEHKGIIANPNCSTIQMVVALKKIHEKYKINKLVVSTYQAVSGAGNRAVNELMSQSHDEDSEPKVLPYINGKKHYPIAYNLLAQIDDFSLENSFTYEEIKMINETHKILDPNIEVIPTCVRVPVYRGHSESVYLEFENEINIDEVRELLESSPLVKVIDDIKEQLYPQPINCANNNNVYVGRIRKSINNNKALLMWVVADNLLIGAATNAIGIAFDLLEYKLL